MSSLQAPCGYVWPVFDAAGYHALQQGTSESTCMLSAGRWKNFRPRTRVVHQKSQLLRGFIGVPASQVNARWKPPKLSRAKLTRRATSESAVQYPSV